MLAAEIEIEESLDTTAPVVLLPQSILLGVDLVVKWKASNEMESRETSPGAWIGLYKAGECDEDNEWQHRCHLAFRSLPSGTAEGEVRFQQQDYMVAGEYEVRYFRGDTRNRQGFECKGLSGTTSGVYLKCGLVSAAISDKVYIVAGMETREDFIPGVPGLEHVVLV
jgi:hypothetical protein